MFGLFYMLYSGIIAGVSKARDYIDGNNKKQNAIQSGDSTYYDGRNQLRLVKNDRQVYMITQNRHKVIKDLHNGKVYKNLTLEKEQQDIEDAIQSRKTVLTNYQIWKRVEDYKNKYWYECHALPCYKDIKTGKLLKDVRINGIRFYMDVESGYILRPIDNEDMSNIDNKVEIPTIIRVFNQRQDEIKQDKRFKQFWWASSYYYLNDYCIEITNDEEILGRYEWS